MRACALAAGYVALALLPFRGATAVTTCSNSGEFILHTESSTLGMNVCPVRRRACMNLATSLLGFRNPIPVGNFASTLLA